MSHRPTSSVARAVALALLAIGFAVAVGVRVTAAPAPKDPPPDVVRGELSVRQDSPVVLVATADGERVYWLVFDTAEGEAAMLDGIPAGSTVTATGRVRTGGKFRYLVPGRIERD